MPAQNDCRPPFWRCTCQLSLVPLTVAVASLIFVCVLLCPRYPSTRDDPCVFAQLVPRLRKFNRDLETLNTVLTDLIARAKASENKADLEDLQARNYDKVRWGGGKRGYSPRGIRQQISFGVFSEGNIVSSTFFGLGITV